MTVFLKMLHFLKAVWRNKYYFTIPGSQRAKIGDMWDMRVMSEVPPSNIGPMITLRNLYFYKFGITLLRSMNEWMNTKYTFLTLIWIYMNFACLEYHSYLYKHTLLNGTNVITESIINVNWTTLARHKSMIIIIIWIRFYKRLHPCFFK